MTPAGAAGTDRGPPLLLTPGEPAGIGGELALQAWSRRTEAGVPVFALFDDPARLEQLARELGWDVPVRAISAPDEAAAVFADALPVLTHRFPARAVPGHPDPENGGMVMEAIRRAVDCALEGRAAAFVTNPIAKSALYRAGFDHPGHTEYLAALAADGRGRPAPVMMLACPQLRVVPVTVHIPLRKVPDALTSEAIVHAGRVTAAALERDFRIEAPRLAVAGVNPHAGESGTMGREEVEVIEPAIDALRTAGIDARGPLAADSMFHPAARGQYDAALCAYHDQALIPLKTLDFAHGVNITLGLPFIRTSPDHGTAFNIAGRGKADPTSLIEALKTARQLADGRARSRWKAVG